MFLFAIDAHTVLETSQNCRYSYQVAENYARTLEEALMEPLFHTDQGYTEFGTERDRAGYILQKDNCIIVSFHGTRNWADKMTDLNFRLEDLKNFRNNFIKYGKVHTGFLKRTKMIYRSLIESLNQYRHLGLPFIFTGHSMGGALAEIAAFNFKLDHEDAATKVVTFGCPKIFNDEAARKFAELIASENHIRIIHSKDPIPEAPIPFALHPKSRVFRLGPQKNISFGANFIKRRFKYHKIEAYQASIAALLDQGLRLFN